MADVKFGRRPAYHDVRVPRFASVGQALPAPPLNANWYADIESWPVLANDRVGDCVEAAVLHLIQQQSRYAPPYLGLQASDAEAIALYSAVAGYVPGDDATDQGSYVLGPNGVMQYWTNTGVTIGGVLNKCAAYLAVNPADETQWMQAINVFGGLLAGISLPQTVVAHAEVPFVWSDPTGPVAGGHEILLVGYETTPHGRVYDLISWGQHYRATSAFLRACLDEAVCVYDRISLDARGLNAAGIDEVTLLADMTALKSEGIG